MKHEATTIVLPTIERILAGVEIKRQFCSIVDACAANPPMQTRSMPAKHSFSQSGARCRSQSGEQIAAQIFDLRGICVYWPTKFICSFTTPGNGTRLWCQLPGSHTKFT